MLINSRHDILIFFWISLQFLTRYCLSSHISLVTFLLLVKQVTYYLNEHIFIYLIMSFEQVYALAQCTPDISSDTCKACLSQAISGLPTSCKKSKSCKVVLLNCFIWYEFFLFYNSKASAAPLVQNTPPPQIISENDHRRNWIFSARTIIAIAVPVISIVFIILIVGLSCFRRKAKGRKGKPKGKTSS